MIREEIAQLDTSAPALRRFGFVVGGVFLLLGGLFLWRGKAAAPWLITPGSALAVLGLVFPSGLRRIYLGWMSMALVLGLIVSTVLLAFFFYGVVTPVGWVAKLLGKDFLQRRIEIDRASYWIPRTPAQAATRKEDYERQF